MASLFENLSSSSPTNGIKQYDTALKNQKGAVNQYTGNTGYQNTLNQAKQGAAMTAGLAGQQSQQAARNAGMSKAQAAMMGANTAASAYGNNFANQQGLVAGLGQQAVSGAQGITGATQYIPSYEQQAKQAEYNRAQQNLQTIGNIAGNIGGAMIGLSDERMKEIVDDAKNRYGSLSKMIEGIDNYVYEYTDEAKEAYPGEADEKKHIGVIAQELESNPITAGSVVTDENGIKHVDTKELTLEQMAIIADMARRISTLEEAALRG